MCFTPYALQGLKVWHITLEDPLEEVEDRIDANLSGLPKARLRELPNRLKKRFRAARAKNADVIAEAQAIAAEVPPVSSTAPSGVGPDGFLTVQG